MKKRILILDDKETIGKVLMMYLATEYDCTWFDNPLKGLDWMRQGNIPDLIISDIRMPEMRGVEFLAYLKKDLMFASVPVVILSGEDSSTERIRLLQEGAEDFIIKPFNPMELKIRIKKILD